MNKNEYQILAHALRTAKPPTDEYERLKQWNITVEAVTYELAKDNPKFKSAYFHHAAGYGWEASLEKERSV